jgi:hypothetical protein
MERGARKECWTRRDAAVFNPARNAPRKGQSMKIGLVSAAASAALVLSTTAFGQAPASAPKPAATAAAPAAAAPAAAAASTTTTADYSEQRLDGSQVVTFRGDPLEGDAKSFYGFEVRRPPGVLRKGLIRPRVNFVSELLKSVENL